MGSIIFKDNYFYDKNNLKNHFMSEVVCQQDNLK